MPTTRLLCCLLACLLPGCAQLSTGHHPDARSDTLTVLTYNTHHGEGTDGVLDLERIARVITDSGAELVALQEIDRHAARTGGVDQAAELGRLTGMHHAFVPFMDFQGGQYGLAVLSAYPIGSFRAIELPPGQREPRAALAAEIDIPGHGPLTFVCLHLDWLGDDAERYAQAGALVEALADESPVILAGDFNDTPGSRTLELLEEHYRDVPKPVGATNTFPSDAPNTQIDFIKYRPASAWLGAARVLDEAVASDHRPVLATLMPAREPRPPLDPAQTTGTLPPACSGTTIHAWISPPAARSLAGPTASGSPGPSPATSDSRASRARPSATAAMRRSSPPPGGAASARAGGAGRWRPSIG